MSCIILPVIGIAIFLISSPTPTVSKAFHPRVESAKLIDFPADISALRISLLRSNNCTLYPAFVK